jgi:hypothetical protein
MDAKDIIPYKEAVGQEQKEVTDLANLAQDIVTLVSEHNKLVTVVNNQAEYIKSLEQRLVKLEGVEAEVKYVN